MSTIGLKYHNEDIHNIIHKPLAPVIKSPRYKSKRKVSFSEKKKYNGHQTFGLAHYQAPESKNYLKKGKQQPVLSAAKLLNKRELQCSGNCKGSSIPKPNFQKRKQTNKNFVKENMKKVLSIQPKVPVPRKVETPRGTVKDLAHLLQMIKIRESEDYGKIPKYLCERKKKLEEERERQWLEKQALKEYKEKMGIGSVGMGENVYMVDNETRQKILDGLKENWNELSKQFLKLPVMTDTYPKIKRKVCLEREIEQLEKDIRLVESHPYIYLEKLHRPSEELLAEDINQGKIEEPQPEEEFIEEPVKESKEQAVEPQNDEAAEEKKEEDKEINIYNY